MKTFLVDTENICICDFLKKTKLTEEDTIVLFVTESTNKTLFKNIEKLKDLKATIIIEHVKSGTKNALDFQLVTYLTLNSYENNNSKYIVVSNDKGYDISIEYLKTKKNIDAERTSLNVVKEEKKEIKKETKKKKKKVKEKNKVDTTSKTQELNLSEKDLIDIFNKSKNKSEYCKNLQNMGDKYKDKYYKNPYLTQFIHHKITTIIDTTPFVIINDVLKETFGLKTGEKYFKRYVIKNENLQQKIAI